MQNNLYIDANGVILNLKTEAHKTESDLTNVESVETIETNNEASDEKTDNYTIQTTEIGSVNEGLSLEFNKENFVKGVIYSEILGKPRCKKKK